MCVSAPKAPKPQIIPERQALKLPDGGVTGPRLDEEIRRRRAMMASAYTGGATLGAGPATTTVLGG